MTKVIILTEDFCTDSALDLTSFNKKIAGSITTMEAQGYRLTSTVTSDIQGKSVSSWRYQCTIMATLTFETIPTPKELT